MKALFTIAQRKFIICAGVILLAFITYWFTDLSGTHLENIVIYVAGIYVVGNVATKAVPAAAEAIQNRGQNPGGQNVG